MEAQASADSAVPAKQPLKHKSLPRSPRAGKQSSRALTKDTFKDPALITDGNEHIDSGSEADEFRRKMEKLRQDVGANNWLSVYANAVQSKQAP